MNWKYAIILLVIALSSCEKSQDREDVLFKLYGDVYEDIGYSIAKSGDGYVIGGQFTEIFRIGGNYIEINKSINNKKMAIIKTDINGIVIWKKSFGDKLTAIGSKVLALDDGSVICTGYVVDSVTLQKDIFVVKIDADGNNPVQKIFKSAGNQFGTDIIQTPEGFLILGSTDVENSPVTDSTGNAAGKKDILLMRINTNLDQIGAFPTVKGFPGNDIGVAIKADINGGYIVVGTTDRSEYRNTQQAGNNILLLKVNSQGDVLKTRIIGGISDEYATDIAVLSDGYLVPVTVGSETTNQKGYILKVPADIYATPVFGPDIKFSTSANILSYSFKAISSYKSNSYVIAGQTGTTTSSKMLIFVLDANGNQVDGKEKIFGGSGAQAAYDVISDENDNIISVGKNSYENNSMISLLKFRF
jgi:hypothetical protein